MDFTGTGDWARRWRTVPEDSVCGKGRFTPHFRYLSYIGLGEIKEHPLKAVALEVVSSKDSQISLKIKELEGAFGEGIEVRRKLADQHVRSVGRLW